MRIWLVEILVRLGVAVIADGRCRPRWYGSDQERVCRTEQRGWWHRPFGLGAMLFGRTKLTATEYYLMRKRVTGSNWQHRQYRHGLLLNLWPTLSDDERYMLAGLNADNYHEHRGHPLVKRVVA